MKKKLVAVMMCAAMVAMLGVGCGRNQVMILHPNPGPRKL